MIAIIDPFLRNSPISPSHYCQEPHIDADQHICRPSFSITKNPSKHRDSISSVSTAITAVDTTDSLAAYFEPATHIPAKTSPSSCVINSGDNATSFDASIDPYDNVQQLADVLLSQIRYISQLRRQLETHRDALHHGLHGKLDQLVLSVSPSPTIPKVWLRSPTPALLPV